MQHDRYRGEKTAAGADILQNVHAVVDEMLEDGMKVIAVAYKTMSRAALVPEEEHDFILLGYLAFLMRQRRVPQVQFRSFTVFM